MEISQQRRCSWIVAVLIMFSVWAESNGALMADYQSLVSTIFNGYNTGIRPRTDDTSPTYIYLGMSLLSIQALDEIKQELTIACYFTMGWVDPSLSWKPSSYNDINYFSYPQQNVWIPDVTIGNSVDTMEELGFDRNYVYILSSGFVYWKPGGVFKTSCNIDVTYYPFDTQSCTVEFTTRISESGMVDLELQNVPVETSEYTESGTWDLVSVEATSQPNFSNYTVVAFTLNLKRLSTYYVVSIIFPVVFLSLTATLVFALPADSGEKMGTSITVLLAFAVYLTIVADQMPKTSLHVSLIAVWLTMLLGMTATGVVLTVWVVNLHFRDDAHPPGKRMRKMAVMLQLLICKRPWGEQVSPTILGPALPTEDNFADPSGSDRKISRQASPLTFKKRPLPTADIEVEQDVPEMTWRTVAWTFDRFFFYFFSLLVTTVSFVFLIVLMTGG